MFHKWFVLVSSEEIKISKSNVLAYVLTTLSVIVVLVCVIAFIFVRHKRLQLSFFNFASSHYNSNSGAATFQQGMGKFCYLVLKWVDVEHYFAGMVS